MRNYDKYFTRLSAAISGEIKGPALNGIKTLFDKYADGVIEVAVGNIEDTPTIPRNLFGFVKQSLREAAMYVDRNTERKASWVGEDEECIDSNDWAWAFACISIMLSLAKHHGKDYASMNKYFSDGYNKALNAGKLQDYLKRFYETMKKVQSESNEISVTK